MMHTHISVLQGEKLRPREAWLLAQGHTGEPGLLTFHHHSPLLAAITGGFLPRQIPTPEFRQLLFLNPYTEGSFFGQFQFYFIRKEGKK